MTRSRFLRRTALMMTSTSSMIAVVLALVLIGALALRHVDKPRNVRLAIGPADSVDVEFGEALHRELPKGFESASVAAARGFALEDIAAAVDEDKAELAIVRTDVAMPKQAGTMLVVHRDAALFLALPGCADHRHRGPRDQKDRHRAGRAGEYRAARRRADALRPRSEDESSTCR